MNEFASKYEISPREMARGRNLKLAAWASPIVLTVLPIAISLFALLLLGSSAPMAATIIFFGFIITIIGFIKGLLLSGIFAYKYSKWLAKIREVMAADGIKAEEVKWFHKELRPSEKKALNEIERNDALLADAYRETLASRLTATRILRSSKRELLLTERRKAKLKLLGSSNTKDFVKEIEIDAEKLSSINSEAAQMLAEAESRLQMIEAAALRGGGLADSELALKKLSARSSALPLALEEARMADEIRRELETEQID
ncbi:MAG TPA: hypothetical protein DEA22_13975 [Blastocatellia bacterium]|nr:hypothetical protein [Blastocatellia bacterium]